MDDAAFYDLVDYYYEARVDAKLTAAENLRQVVDLGGYIATTDAEYASWLTGVKPDAAGRTELTEAFRQALADEDIEIVTDKGETNE